MKKTIIFIVACCSLFTIKGQAQELLNKNKAAIDQYAKSQNAKMNMDQVISGMGQSPFRMLIYTFDESAMAKSGIYQIMFHLSKGKCFRYLIAYNSTKYKAPLIQKLDAQNLSKRKNGETLIWTNDKAGYDVQIVNTYSGGTPGIRGGISTMFMLEYSLLKHN